MRGRNSDEWDRWFAWRPVFVANDRNRLATSGQWVWFEWVWRKKAVGMEGNSPASLWAYRDGDSPPTMKEWNPWG